GKWRFVQNKLDMNKRDFLKFIQREGNLNSQTIESMIADDKGDQHAKFGRESFENNVFKSKDLKDIVDKAVEAYLADLTGLEGELLIKIQADISDADPDMPLFFPNYSERAFKAKFATQAAKIKRVVSRDLQEDIGREIATWVVGDLAGQVGIQVFRCIAVKMGADAGFLSGGLATGVATVGIGLIAAILLDLAIDEVLEATGRDAVTVTSKRITQTLVEVADLVRAGVPEA